MAANDDETRWLWITDCILFRDVVADRQKMLSVPSIVIFSMLLFHLGSVLCEFELVVLHTNDMHSRFEEVEKNSGTCKAKNKNKKCVGGFARVAHEVETYRKFHKSGQDVVFLNAGDTFVGTAWFSLFKAEICTEFINALKPDVIVSIY